MINDKDIKSYHETTLKKDILPNEWGLLRTNKIKIHPDQLTHSKFKTTGNLPREQENEFMYSNPNIPFYNVNKEMNKVKQGRSKKYSFGYNNLLNIEKNKLMSYFICENYDTLFNLFEIYIMNLFNGLDKKGIEDLFKNELITDSVYIDAMKCIELISVNKQLYKHNQLRNINNRLVTSEIRFQIEIVGNPHAKDDALFLIIKFIDLLKSIDENLFQKEISTLEEVYTKNNYSGEEIL